MIGGVRHFGVGVVLAGLHIVTAGCGEQPVSTPSSTEPCATTLPPSVDTCSTYAVIGPGQRMDQEGPVADGVLNPGPRQEATLDFPWSWQARRHRIELQELR